MLRARLALHLALLTAPLAACAARPAPATAAPPATKEAPAPAKAADTPADHVDGAKAKKLVGDGARLVDVRGPDEYATKHIDGAVNVPVETVGEHDFGPKDTPLVLYCRSGKRASRAAAALRSKGYTRVYELGAMTSWGD